MAGHAPAGAAPGPAGVSGPEPESSAPTAVSIDGFRTPRATCLLAPNPSPMTLDGTNTWLIAEPGSPSVVVIDPGPDDEGHLRRVHAEATAGDRRVARIVLTHGHPDHSAGAARLAELTGAPVQAADPARRLGTGRARGRRRGHRRPAASCGWSRPPATPPTRCACCCPPTTPCSPAIPCSAAGPRSSPPTGTSVTTCGRWGSCATWPKTGRWACCSPGTARCSPTRSARWTTTWRTGRNGWTRSGRPWRPGRGRPPRSWP